MYSALKPCKIDIILISDEDIDEEAETYIEVKHITQFHTTKFIDQVKHIKTQALNSYP